MSEEKLSQYTDLINNLVSECVKCSPASWSEGLLSIDSNGLYINYKLKNKKSKDTALISDPLRFLCEEIYVVMRKNDDIWIDASLHYFKQDGSWNYKLNFNYSNKKIEKPWWKFFESTFDEKLFEGVWIGRVHDKKEGSVLMSRTSYSSDGKTSTHYKMIMSDSRTDEHMESGSWKLIDGILIRETRDQWGSDRKCTYPLVSISKNKLKYKEPTDGLIHCLVKANKKLESQWDSFFKQARV